MQKVKCFEVVEQLITEGSKQFAPLFQVNGENVKILAQYCHYIDLLCEEFEGESYDIEIDDINLTVQIVMECHKINCNHYYLKALKERAIEFDVDILPKEDLFQIKFVFPSVWDRVDVKDFMRKFFDN